MHVLTGARRCPRGGGWGGAWETPGSEPQEAVGPPGVHGPGARGGVESPRSLSDKLRTVPTPGRLRGPPRVPGARPEEVGAPLRVSPWLLLTRATDPSAEATGAGVQRMRSRGRGRERHVLGTRNAPHPGIACRVHGVDDSEAALPALRVR